MAQRLRPFSPFPFFSLSPLLRGEDRGEGCFHKQNDSWTPSPRPSPPKKGEREKKEEGGEGAHAECSLMCDRLEWKPAHACVPTRRSPPAPRRCAPRRRPAPPARGPPARR